MSDRHVVSLTKTLGVPLDPFSFTNISTYNSLKQLLQSYAPSTASTHIWHLHRYLSEEPDFPAQMLSMYTVLLTKYQQIYNEWKSRK